MIIQAGLTKTSSVPSNSPEPIAMGRLSFFLKDENQAFKIGILDPWSRSKRINACEYNALLLDVVSHFKIIP